MPPETSDREISADLLGKKRQKEKRSEIEKKRRKIVKGKVEKLPNEEMRRGPFFFFFFASHFSKPLKFVLGLPKWKFSTGKKHFTPGKKIRKNDFAPQKNFPVTPLRIARLSTSGGQERTISSFFVILLLFSPFPQFLA